MPFPHSAIVGQVETQVVVRCVFCRTAHQFIVPTPSYHRWQSGMLIQQAFPELSAGDRELLISGTCPTCFDAMFSDAPSHPEVQDS